MSSTRPAHSSTIKPIYIWVVQYVPAFVYCPTNRILFKLDDGAGQSTAHKADRLIRIVHKSYLKRNHPLRTEIERLLQTTGLKIPKVDAVAII